MVDAPLAIFAVVFAVIGGLELLDRTNFALISLASRQDPRASWAGSAGAFVLTSALSVGLGAVLLDALHGEVVYLRLGGGVFLLGYAGYLYLVPEAERATPSVHSAWLSAFLLIFLLELGDTTMVFTIVFVATLGNPIVVFLAAASALVLVAASACLIGSHLGAKVEPRALERVVVVVLTVVGVVTILYALFPGWFPSLG